VTEDENIRDTLAETSGEKSLLRPGRNDERDCDPRSYAVRMIAALSERIPNGELKTCRDFQHVGVECCECCHSGYVHFEMEVEDLCDGGKAWLCCALRRALLYPGEKSQDSNSVARANRATEVNPDELEKPANG
jgi:hypothetical protein